MAQDKQFLHITVNAAEDDDIVIVAGAPAAGATKPQVPSAQDEPAYGEGAGQGIEVPVSEEDFAADEASLSDLDADEAPLSDRDAEEAAEAAHTAAPASSDQAWREQTLEDLEAGPMSNMQKIVLGVAAIFVVVAIVWYFCFMR